MREQGWDTQRAQQLENWHSQQEVLASRKAQRAMTDDFDNVSTPDEDWRKLASFGVERNEVRFRFSLFSREKTEESFGQQASLLKRFFSFCLFTIFQDFDMDEAFGAVQAGGDLEGVIELTGRMNGPAGVHEFGLRVSRKKL